VTKLDVTKARQAFAETVNQVAYKGERVLIQKHGKPVAALVPVADLELIEWLEDQIDVEEARRIMADAADRIVPWKEAKTRLGL
jgi:prevent-host-death family protein